MADEQSFIAFIASLDTKPDFTKMSALLKISKVAVEGRYRHSWRPRAEVMINEAKQDGRLHQDGTVVVEALKETKKRGKGKGKGLKGEEDGAGSAEKGLHRTRAGRVTKQGVGGGRKGKVAGDEDDNDDDDDEDKDNWPKDNKP